MKQQIILLITPLEMYKLDNMFSLLTELTEPRHTKRVNYTKDVAYFIKQCTIKIEFYQ